MKRKSIYCYIMAALMCLSLLPILPSQVKVASATTEDLVLYMKFDGNLNDSSGNSYNGECTYGKIAYEDGIFGQCAVFKDKSYVEVEDQDDLDLRDSLTISLWAYKEEMNQEFVPYVTKAGDSDTLMPPYQLYEHNRLAPSIFLNDGTGDSELYLYRVDGKEIDIRKWFLLTATYSGNEVRIYCNGQLMKKENVTGSAAITTGNLTIGMQDGELYFTGKMDDLRIYNRALKADEVKTLYDDGMASKPEFLKQTDKLVGQYKFENDFKDSAGSGNDAQRATSIGTISYVNAICGKGAKFEKGSYLEVKDNDSINFDQGFTVTGWICANKVGIDMPILNRTGVSASESSNEMAYKFTVSDEQCGYFFVPFNPDNFSSESSWYSMENSMLKKWYHIAITFDTKNVKFYKNGVLVQKDEMEGFPIAHANGNLMIGSDGEQFFEGTLDELKLYNYALSAEEVTNEASRKDSIFISEDNINSIKELKVNNTVTLKTSRKYVDTGKTEAITSGVTYKSSNKKLFTVSSTGVIKAIKKGTAYLTVSHGGLSVRYKVNIDTK